MIDRNAKNLINANRDTFAGIIPGSTEDVMNMSTVTRIYMSTLTKKGPIVSKALLIN
jgi:hypothetical protein